MSKSRLLEGFEKFIDAKIDLRTLGIRPSLNQEQVEERVRETRCELLDLLFEEIE